VIRHGGRALIADEMGCGKTVQAIAVMEHYQKHWPALVLMPPGLMSQWKGELLRFCEGLLKENDICVVRKASDKAQGKVCLVSYTILQSLVESGKLRPEQFGIVICDESHNLKNREAKRTNLAVPFLKKATVALCLSGTPATNRPVELYTQLNALLPKVFNDYDAFVRRYCDAKQSNFNKGLDVRGCSNAPELKLILEGLVMIRRLKSDVASELPDKQREGIVADYQSTMCITCASSLS
jgi:SWI/SNF-related matrix-associated actin-dependent regulator 1 of chromatin subfamily A